MIDGRVPHNPSQAKQLEHAEQLIVGGHADQALERLEFLLTNSDRATIRTADGRPEGLSPGRPTVCSDGSPAHALDNVSSAPRGAAQPSCLTTPRKRATGTRSWTSRTRYFHSQTGKQAANAIGNFHFDRGEFGLAALWYARVLHATPAVAQDPKWSLKAALALRQSGKTKDSDELLRRLQPSGVESQVDVGGDSVKSSKRGCIDSLVSISPRSLCCRNGCSSLAARAARGPPPGAIRSCCPAGSSRPRRE